ncbi:MAG TPA: hypothetical protein PKA55_01500 [Rhodoblastus sp.]|nr:hypothetical protein [Rhodoblastus sp.]
MRGVVIVIVMALAAAIGQMLTDPRITRAFIGRTMIVVGVYILFCAIGLGFLSLLYVLGRHDDTGAFAAVIAWLGWLGLAMAGLIRLAPRTSEPPRWMTHFGAWDIVCLAMIAGGAAASLGLA